MEAIDDIVEDWHECRGGAAVPACRLHEVLNLAAERITRSGADEERRRDAYALLAPTWAGSEPEPPVFVRMLRLDGSDRDQIYFLRFWQAMQQVCGLLLGCTGAAAESEPLAEEASALRDALLRRTDSGELSRSWLAAEVTRARGMSADEAAWASLEAAVLRLGVPKEAASGRRSRGADAPLRIEEASELLFTWLQDIAEDYGRGQRGAKIKAVRDVAGCSAREACFHLGCRGWEVEAALLSYYGGGAVPSMAMGKGRGWSSHGAKLCKNEVECPICAEPYGKAERLVTGCCFQVLCTTCRAKLMQPGGFHCPFCRTVEGDDAKDSSEYAQHRTGRPSLVSGFFRALRATSG